MQVSPPTPNPSAQAATIHRTLERELEVALELTADGPQGEIRIERAWEREGDVAADRRETQVAGTGQRVDLHVDVAAHRAGRDPGSAYTLETDVAAHRPGAYFVADAVHLDVAAHRVRRQLEPPREAYLEVDAATPPPT